MNNKLGVVNRKEHNTMYSNIVYPDWVNTKKFKIHGKLDSDYVEDTLTLEFGCDSIANKYAVLMPNGFLWYQHDFSTYILEML